MSEYRIRHKPSGLWIQAASAPALAKLIDYLDRGPLSTALIRYFENAGTLGVEPGARIWRSREQVRNFVIQLPSNNALDDFEAVSYGLRVEPLENIVSPLLERRRLIESVQFYLSRNN